MKKNGFTLIELMIVVALIASISILVTIKISRNIKEASELKESNIYSSIESSAYIYATNYLDELVNLNSNNVDTVTVNTLVEKGLVKENEVISELLSNKVLIAKINNKFLTYFNKDWEEEIPVIFINGLDSITISQNDLYVDSGAYVVTLSGISILDSSNITSNVNTSIIGTYKVTYNYPNAISKERIVYVV